MGFFTCILILIVLYCPWLIPVLFVVFILSMIYHYSPVLFGILVGGIVIVCIVALVYTFQDQDNTQMHMYMPTYAFENFFGNMQVTIMEQMGLLDTTDAAAVKAVFDSIDDAVETINVSFVMTRAK